MPRKSRDASLVLGSARLWQIRLGFANFPCGLHNRGAANLQKSSFRQDTETSSWKRALPECCPRRARSTSALGDPTESRPGRRIFEDACQLFADLIKPADD